MVTLGSYGRGTHRHQMRSAPSDLDAPLVERWSTGHLAEPMTGQRRHQWGARVQYLLSKPGDSINA